MFQRYIFTCHGKAVPEEHKEYVVAGDDFGETEQWVGRSAEIELEDE